MSAEEVALSIKQVPDMLIASNRFRGKREDIGAHLDRLYKQVKQIVNGKPLCLHHGGQAPDGLDMEVCFPVLRPADGDEIKTRTLEGGWMICAQHVGPYGSSDQEGSLSKSWGRLYAAIARGGIGLAEGPPREVYVESKLEHDDDAHSYVTELQEYLLLPRWLDRMARGLENLVGEEIKKQIMAGCEKITPLSASEEKVRWVKGAIQRLDTMVEEEARREIMAGCAHIFPEERISRLRVEYERLGDIDGLLELMGQDRSMGEYSYYSAPKREGNVILTTKIPHNPKDYRDAQDDTSRRAAYCHCPVIKAAIRAGQPISATFCYCGSGWFKRLWQGILGKPVQVEVVKSVLQGHDSCQFAIHLPPEAVTAQ